MNKLKVGLGWMIMSVRSVLPDPPSICSHPDPSLASVAVGSWPHVGMYYPALATCHQQWPGLAKTVSGSGQASRTRLATSASGHLTHPLLSVFCSVTVENRHCGFNILLLFCRSFQRCCTISLYSYRLWGEDCP